LIAIEQIRELEVHAYAWENQKKGAVLSRLPNRENHSGRPLVRINFD
jgi:hypothetical protein